MTRVAPCDNFIEGYQCQRVNEMELPSCAMLGRRGTVIVRIMGACEVCSRPVCWPQDLRSCLLKCELCSRTSFYCQCSDCDSVLDRCRPYRASAARSRDVNVCTAICLLLLLGSITPRSSAKPVGEMEKIDRSYWEDPCDYNYYTDTHVDYTAKLPDEVATKAREIIRKVKEYQNDYANYTHSYEDYEDLLNHWKETDWFRKVSWVAAKNLLPREHTFNTTVPDEQIEELLKSDEKLDELLPHMFKGLKLVVASWKELYGNVLTIDKYDEKNVTKKVNDTLPRIRTMLCHFNDLMIARKLPVNNDLLDINDIPEFDESTKYEKRVVVFRDCIYYVEYLEQFFNKMYEKHSASLQPATGSGLADVRT